jgi:hypothetical protein
VGGLDGCLSIIKPKRRKFSRSEKRVVALVCIATSVQKVQKLLQKQSVYISSRSAARWVKQLKNGELGLQDKNVRLTGSGKQAVNNSGNLKTSDFGFEQVVATRVAFLRVLGAPISDSTLVRLMKNIRDVQQADKWRNSPIKKCSFSNGYISKFKGRNGLASRKVNSKLKKNEATPEEIEGWQEEFQSEIDGCLFGPYLKLDPTGHLLELLKPLLLAMIGNTDETPLLFENLGSYTNDFRGLDGKCKDLGKEKTQMTLTPIVTADGTFLPELYITSGKTKQTLVNVVKEFLELGELGMVECKPGANALVPGSYIFEDPNIRYKYYTESNVARDEPLAYLKMKGSGSIVTYSKKGWMTGITFTLMMKHIFAPHVNKIRSQLCVWLARYARTLDPEDPCQVQADLQNPMMHAVAKLAQGTTALLNFDNYRAHEDPAAEAALRAVGAKGYLLVPNATKHIQVLDTHVNGPKKCHMRQNHSGYLVDKMNEYLENHPPPSDIEDVEHALRWAPPADMKIPAPTRAQVIIWNESCSDVWRGGGAAGLSTCPKAKAIRNGFVSNGQAPQADGKYLMFVKRQQDREARLHSSGAKSKEAKKQAKARKQSAAERKDAKLILEKMQLSERLWDDTWDMRDLEGKVDIALSDIPPGAAEEEGEEEEPE